MDQAILRLALTFGAQFLKGLTPALFDKAIDFTVKILLEMYENAGEDGLLDADFRLPYERRILDFYRTLGIAREF